MTVQRMTVPSSSKFCVMPSFLPMMPGCVFMRTSSPRFASGNARPFPRAVEPGPGRTKPPSNSGGPESRTKPPKRKLGEFLGLAYGSGGISMTMDYRTAFVTGASSGIGFELAKRLAREGMLVGIAARRENELRTARA